MNNPFKDDVTLRVLDNITSSIREQYRQVLLVYLAPSHCEVIDRHRGFIRVKEGEIFGYPFVMYSN